MLRIIRIRRAGIATLVIVGSLMLAGAIAGKDKNRSQSVISERVAKLAGDLATPDYSKHREAYSRLDLLAQSSEADSNAALTVLQQFDDRAKKWTLLHGYESRETWFYVTKKTPPKSMTFIYLAERSRRLGIVGMAGNHITDEHVSYLNGLPAVTILDIDQAAISGATLANINLPSLKVLRLAGCPITDDAALQMKFPKLATLDLSGTRITDQFMKRMEMTQVSELSLRGTQVTSQGVRMLAKLANLGWLTVDLEDVDTGAVEVINKMSKMTRIRLVATEGSDVRLRSIRRQLDHRIVLYTRMGAEGRWVKLAGEEQPEQE